LHPYAQELIKHLFEHPALPKVVHFMRVTKPWKTSPSIS